MWTGTGVPSEPWSARRGRPPTAAHRARAASSGRTGPTTTRPATRPRWDAARIFLGPYRRAAEAAGAVARLLLQPGERGRPEPAAAGHRGRLDGRPGGYRPRRSWLRGDPRAGPGREPRRRAGGAPRCAPGPRRAGPTSSTASGARRPSAAYRRAFLARYEAGGRWLRAARSLARELRLVERRRGGCPASRTPRSPSRRATSSRTARPARTRGASRRSCSPRSARCSGEGARPRVPRPCAPARPGRGVGPARRPGRSHPDRSRRQRVDLRVAHPDRVRDPAVRGARQRP